MSSLGRGRHDAGAERLHGPIFFDQPKLDCEPPQSEQVFDRRVRQTECHKVSGLADYMLKIRAADVEAYEAFQTRFLLRSPYVRSVQSSFVLKEVKATTELLL